MNGPLQGSFFSCPCRGGSAFVPCWWLWLKFWGPLQSHSMFLPQPKVPKGHSPPLCFTCAFAGAVCSHLTPPLSLGSVTGNIGRLSRPGRPSAQSPGHKHSAQALLALCPTGEGATAHPSFHLPQKAYNEAGGHWERNAEGSSGLTCRSQCWIWTSWSYKRRMWLSWQLMVSGTSCPMSRWHKWCGTSFLVLKRTHTGTITAGYLPGSVLVPSATPSTYG